MSDKILGKSPEELLQPPISSRVWKITQRSDDHEMMFKLCRMPNLQTSIACAKFAADIAKSYNQDNADTYFSVSSESLMICLHGFSEGKVPESVKRMAEEIDKAIADAL